MKTLDPWRTAILAAGLVTTSAVAGGCAATPGPTTPVNAASAGPLGSPFSDIAARFTALTSDGHLTYVVSSTGTGTYGGAKATMGGQGRVNGDDVDLFFGSNSAAGGATTKIVTVAGRTRMSVNGGPWLDVPAALSGSSLWLGAWGRRPITDGGIVPRGGIPLHELQVEASLTDPTGLLPIDAVISERATSVYVRDDGTPVYGHDAISASLPGSAGPVDVKIEVNYSITAIGVIQAIELPSG